MVLRAGGAVGGWQRGGLLLESCGIRGAFASDFLLKAFSPRKAGAAPGFVRPTCAALLASSPCIRPHFQAAFKALHPGNFASQG